MKDWSISFTHKVNHIQHLNFKNLYFNTYFQATSFAYKSFIHIYFRFYFGFFIPLYRPSSGIISTSFISSLGTRVMIV